MRSEIDVQSFFFLFVGMTFIRTLVYHCRLLWRNVSNSRNFLITLFHELRCEALSKLFEKLHGFGSFSQLAPAANVRCGVPYLLNQKWTWQRWWTCVLEKYKQLSNTTTNNNNHHLENCSCENSNNKHTTRFPQFQQWRWKVPLFSQINHSSNARAL